MLPQMLPWEQIAQLGDCEGLQLKCLKMLAPRAGFEPATNRLTAGCSTTELPGNRGSHVSGAAYSKPVSALQRSISYFRRFFARRFLAIMCARPHMSRLTGCAEPKTWLRLSSAGASTLPERTTDQT